MSSNNCFSTDIITNASKRSWHKLERRRDFIILSLLNVLSQLISVTDNV